MATVQPMKRSSSHEGASSMRARPEGESERSSSRIGTLNRPSEENRVAPAIPKAFESMLKTTTETGDIGLFSIKPSRVPQSLNSPRRISGSYRDDLPQKPRTFQPYGPTGVDDRRRLPSYSRDAASEVISMYETASQKSASRVFDDPDYRSHSMTQTSSTHSLSNHRSYASLRSQPEGSALLQRPRSPFAYPTRLKRPGFRPSSPALIDGGVVDYSRRAEIERPHDDRRGTSSPSSLYAQKRKLSSSLRPDANRSTPSLLSQASPARRSPSPHMRQGNSTPTIDWQRRNGLASVNSSPARSTFSHASTANLYQAAPALLATTTPGKIPPPSPLYYDYTEDFDIEDYNQPEPLDPPPQFRIEKTIPEDRPLSSGWQSKGNVDIPGPKTSYSDGTRNAFSAPSRYQKSPQGSQELLPGSVATESVFEVVQKSRTPNTSATDDMSPDTSSRESKDRKVIRLSGLGLGARELNSHVEEAFGLAPSPSFELLISGEHEEDNGGNSSQASGTNGYKSDEIDNDTESQSVRTSSYSLNTHLRQFPSLPAGNSSYTDPLTEADSTNTATLLGELRSPASTAKMHLIESLDFAGSYPGATPIIPAQCSSSIRKDAETLSRVNPIEGGAAGKEQTGVLPRLHKHQPRSSVLKELQQPSSDSPTNSSLHKPNIGTPPNSVFSNRELGSGRSRHLTSEQTLRWRDHRSRGRRVEAATTPSYGATEVPNFSHQIPRKLMSRSESPMLAPKPISPARQLKLKNSVPQLMKALPPLPPEPSVRAVSPPLLLSSSEELPCRFSPLIVEGKPLLSEEAQQVPEPATDSNLVNGKLSAFSPSGSDQGPRETVPNDSEYEDAVEIRPHPKLKLKMRYSGALRPTSSSKSRHWNLEEDYPWSSQNSTVEIPLIVQDNKSRIPKTPKFKLKITRASNSTLGTVRINRESSSDSKPSTGLHLPNPKDLFTPNTGIDGIFRQVSRHLHSRRESMASDHIPLASSLVSSVLDQTTRKERSDSALNPALNDAHLSSTLSTGSRSLPDGRSVFSDDSSKRHGRQNLRKRLTNFRSRIYSPYKSRMGSQSYDDVTWRNRNGAQPHVPLAAKSCLNLPSSVVNTELRHTKRFTGRVRTQRFRARVSEWFKGARSAIASRLKSRSGTGRSEGVLTSDM